MNKATIFILAILTMGCLGGPRPRQSEITGTDRERLITIAKNELKRRNLALPHYYSVVVENGKISNEIDRSPREVYGVWFNSSRRGEERAFYSVLIDKRSGRIDQVSDLRALRFQTF